MSSIFPKPLRRIFLIFCLIFLFLFLAAFIFVSIRALNFWTFRAPVFITNNSGSNLIDYEIQIFLNGENFDFSSSGTTGEGIRFTDNSEQPLSYWIENFDPVKKFASIWVKVPYLKGNTKQVIYLYSGKKNISSKSSGIATFSDFDDFNRTTFYNTFSVWQKYSGNPITPQKFGDPRAFLEKGIVYLFASDYKANVMGLFTSKDGFRFQYKGKVLEKGKTGFDSGNVSDATVVKIGKIYHMWYAGYDAAFAQGFKIGHATSNDLMSWTKDPANPVFERPGLGVNEPSVLFDPEDEEKPLKMLYTVGSQRKGDIGTGNIGYAYSKDGIRWIGQKEVLTGGWQDQYAVKVKDKYYMFVNNIGSQLVVLSSSDFIHWRDISIAGGFTPGPQKYDQGAVYEPSIVYFGNKFFMYYQSRNRTGKSTQDKSDQSISVATSPDFTQYQNEDWLESWDSVFKISNNMLFKNSIDFSNWHSLIRNTKLNVPPYILETEIKLISQNHGKEEYGVIVGSNFNNRFAVMLNPAKSKIALWSSILPEKNEFSVLSEGSYPLLIGKTYKLRAKVTDAKISVDLFDEGVWHLNILEKEVEPEASFTGYYGYGDQSNFYTDNYRIRSYISKEPDIVLKKKEPLSFWDKSILVLSSLLKRW